jgi:putative oxidoreductase
MCECMKAKVIAGWVITVLLAFVFVAAGLMKISGQPMMAANFQGWGYPLWFMTLTGTIEVIAAILLVIPRFAKYGYGLIACVMVGAILTHVTHFSTAQAPMFGGATVLLLLTILGASLRGFISPRTSVPA